MKAQASGDGGAGRAETRNEDQRKMPGDCLLLLHNDHSDADLLRAAPRTHLQVSDQGQ